MSRRLHPEVEALLASSGVPWELRSGRKHHKLFVAGRMVQVVPHGATAIDPKCRAHRNCLASLRRLLREARP